MARASASGSRAKASMTARSVSFLATVSDPFARKPTPATAAPTSSQRVRDRRATSSSSPERRPLTQTSPKLRTDAPTGPASASRWSTVKPASTSSKACHVPTMPPPTTTPAHDSAQVATWTEERMASAASHGRSCPKMALPATNTFAPAAAATGAVVGVDSTVDLEIHRQTAGVNGPAHRGHLRHHLAHEALATEPGEDRHAEHEIDVREVGLDRLERRVRIESETGAQPEGAHLCDERVGVTDLDVHRASVRTGLGERLEIATGFCHHQVAVEVERRMAAQRRHHGRTDRDVRHEVPVHDVDVEPVGRRSDFAHLLGQEAEVGRQDRGCDAQIARTPGIAFPVHRRARHVSRLRAQLKRAQQRMRLKP